MNRRRRCCALDIEVALAGAALEGAHFWTGVRIRRIAPSERSSSLTEAAVVVRPALVEDNPLLLRSIGAGVPVIATPACGLAEGPGITLVPYGDEPALGAAIRHVLRINNS